MSFEFLSVDAIDYLPCRYGASKLMFRGPKSRLTGAYAAVLGGSEAYGKFVAAPFPALLEQALGLPVANFGHMNAGPDIFASEPVVIDACSRARITVVQIMGAENMSNRFYAVHPRRNDRFLRASALMKTIFRNVDFNEFRFTRPMLAALRCHAPEKFELVEAELKAAWVGRMRLLLQKIEGKTLLLWVEGGGVCEPADGLGPAPLFVDERMLRAIRPFASGLVRFAPTAAALHSASDGMIHAPGEDAAASALPGPAVHAGIAAALVPAIRDLI
jgi:hypothetical protein